jgi:hypothetical protein
MLRVGRRNFVALIETHGKTQFDRIAGHGKRVFKVFALRYDLRKRRHGDRKATSFTRGTWFQNDGVPELSHGMEGSLLMRPAPSHGAAGGKCVAKTAALNRSATSSSYIYQAGCFGEL